MMYKPRDSPISRVPVARTNTYKEAHDNGRGCVTPPVVLKYTSNAEWPHIPVTTDKHLTYEEANNVCEELENSGYGGDREHYPVKTWIGKYNAND